MEMEAKRRKAELFILFSDLAAQQHALFRVIDPLCARTPRWPDWRGANGVNFAIGRRVKNRWRPSGFSHSHAHGSMVSSVNNLCCAAAHAGHFDLVVIRMSVLAFS